MAKKDSPGSLPPPKLIVSRAEAAQKIEAQIEKGQQIKSINWRLDADSVQHLDEEYLTDAQHQLAKWSSYNTEMLARLFDNPSIAEEYKHRGPSFLSRKPTLEEAASIFRNDLDTSITRLESILERLDLIPEPTQPNTPSTPSAPIAPLSREIFIVHGHDDTAKESVARVLSQLDLKPIILNEKADAGLTIIEKFEKHANVAFAVILLTPDDIGCAKKEPDQQKPRARQNVILEFGYFLSKLGRGKVCAL